MNITKFAKAPDDVSELVKDFIQAANLNLADYTCLGTTINHVSGSRSERCLVCNSGNNLKEVLAPYFRFWGKKKFNNLSSQEALDAFRKYGYYEYQNRTNKTAYDARAVCVNGTAEEYKRSFPEGIWDPDTQCFYKGIGYTLR